MSPIPPPSTRELLTPLLQSLPAAAVSPTPPAALLPLLSPILRQRVQLLSSSSKEPWLPLLCYDASKTSQLSSIAKSDRFEPHPVSGEVEVDWESEVETLYKRVDEETLQAFVAVKEFGVLVKCLYCVGDAEGGGDGWRVGEVGVLDSDGKSPQGGYDDIGEAEKRFQESNEKSSVVIAPVNGGSWQHVEEEDDDDDAYWAQYDNTPARTPAVKRSPAPDSLRNAAERGSQNEEDAYYAQYASVQPAMDSHDPDEAAQNGEVETTLGGDDATKSLQHNLHIDHENKYEEPLLEPAIISRGSAHSPPSLSPPHLNGNEALEHPRPTSSSGSQDSSGAVERLEKEAAGLGQTESGVRQHIARSTRSLFLLARSAGIDREEFESVVRREMDVLCMLDEDE